MSLLTPSIPDVTELRDSNHSLEGGPATGLDRLGLMGRRLPEEGVVRGIFPGMSARDFFHPTFPLLAFFLPSAVPVS